MGSSWEIAVQKAISGVYQIHDTPNAAAITQLIVKDNGTLECYIVALGGTFDGAQEMSDVIDQFALSKGCSTIQAVGRYGWTKVDDGLTRGYKPFGVIYEKALNNEHTKDH